MKTEISKIVCAANKFVMKDGDELIIPSARHWDACMTHIAMVLGDRLTLDHEEQGFIDQYGNFYTREEAWIIAKKNNQIVHRVGGDEGKLFSENLY